MSEAVLLKNLSKSYGNKIAVKDVSLSIKCGEIFSFLGVNGAGKTTTLRMLVGLLRPSAGSISICGINSLVEPQQAKAITGYIPDRPHLYGKLTAWELLEFVSDLYCVGKKLFSARAEELMESFSLTTHRNELVDSFSHGMKQRLATCAALMHSPKLLVVDEPIVGLDPHGAKRLKRYLREYADSGNTVFLSTHSLNVAQEVSDRIAIIDNGSIVEIGTFSELKEKAGDNISTLEEVFLKITDKGEK